MGRLALLAPLAAAGVAGLVAWRWATSRTPPPSGKILVSEPDLSDLEERYLLEAYRSTFISGGAGNFKKRLETEFSAMCGCSHGVAVCNGTVAISLALLAGGLQRGGEVIVPSFTYVASAAAVVSVGGVPVFVDCDPELGLMDAEMVRRAVSTKTKFIMAVHIYGHVPDMDTINAIAKESNLLVLEDAAEAHGATYKGRPAGSLGDMATFSFYANKVMTTGEGGIIVTNNAALASRMVYLRGHAMSPEIRFWHTDIGFNYRLSNLLCAIGVAQLERFAHLFGNRLRVIAAYRTALQGVGGARVGPAEVEGDCRPSPWLACVWLPREHAGKRDAICDDLERRGVETRNFFYAVHTMPPYISYRMVTPRKQGDVTISEEVAARGFNIPTSSLLTTQELRFISGHVRDVILLHCDPRT